VQKRRFKRRKGAPNLDGPPSWAGALQQPYNRRIIRLGCLWVKACTPYIYIINIRCFRFMK
jgi:hypothetical protein